jgi:aminoarabinose transferase-like protein
LPALPPLAIFAAAGLDALRWMEPGRVQRLFGVFAAIDLIPLLIVSAILGLGIPLKLPGILVWDGFILVLILGAGSTVIWLVTYVSCCIRSLFWEIAVLGLLVIATVAKGRIDATPLSSYRGLASTIASHLTEDCILGSYHHFEQSVPFYTEHREVLVGYRGELGSFGDSPEAAASFIATDGRLRALWSKDTCIILIANHSDLDHLDSLLSPAPSVIAVEGKKVALSNQYRDMLGAELPIADH